MNGDVDEINALLALFRTEHQGLLFVKDSVLPEFTFIAIEAIWWSIEHCVDIQTEQTALDLFQVREIQRRLLIITIACFSIYSAKDIFDIVQTSRRASALDSFSITSLQKRQPIVNMHSFYWLEDHSRMLLIFSPSRRE